MKKRPKRLKKLAGNLGLMGLTLTVMTGLAELALRLTEKPQPEPVMARLYEFDPALSWRPIANQSHKIRTAEFEVTLTTNSQGFRGPAYQPGKPAGMFRVVVLGDSYAEAQQVPLQERFSEQLQSLLEQSSVFDGRAIEIINLGVSGFNTAQELAMFETRGAPLEPDLTILLFCFNDVLLNNRPWHPYQQRPLPYYQWNGQRMTPANRPLARPAGRPYAPRVSGSWKGWLVNHSRLARLTRDAVNNNHVLMTLAVRSGLKKLPAEMRMTEDGRIDLIPLDYYLWHTPYLEQIREGWQMTRQLLVELDRQCRTGSGRLLVLNIPHPVEVNDRAWADTRRKYGIPSDWNRHQIGQELGRICREEGIPCLWEIEPWLAQSRQLARTGQSLYFEQDGHWRPDGHRFVAKLLADHIEAMYRKSQAPPPQTALSP